METRREAGGEEAVGRRTGLACGSCGHEWETGRAPGYEVSCPGCAAPQRVPVPEAGVKRSVTCGSCGQTFQSSQRPGRKARCRCGEKVRVPVPREGERAELAQARTEASRAASEVASEATASGASKGSPGSWRARTNATIGSARPSGDRPLGEFEAHHEAGMEGLQGVWQSGFGSGGANLFAGAFLLPVGLLLAWVGALVWGTILTTLGVLSLIRGLRLGGASRRSDG